MSHDEEMSVSRIVIVGASLAGANAALALRDQGFDGSIALIGEESHPPYERPPLSKAVLLGEADEPDWVRPEKGDLASAGLDLALGTVATRIDRAGKLVVAGGAEYPYDTLLLATGSAARRLDLPHADLPGIHTLRTLDDSLGLRARLTAGARVVVVGAGWIGCEAAAAARSHGCQVTVVEPMAQPLMRVVGGQVGEAFAALHREHGVDLRLGTQVTGFAGAGSVAEVRLEGGATLPADTVIVGVGAAPNIALADAAGLELASGGVAVDAALRSSDADIYAVGDIAAHAHPAYAERIRVEHWATALDQGKHVAANLLGASKPYTKRPFFFSDQYGLGCEYRGHADPTTDRLLIRGDLQGRDFTAFWLRDGAVAAALNVNQWDDGDWLQELVDTGRPVSDDELLGS